jgi:hypothetical protein
MRLTWWRGRGLWLLLTTDSTQNAVHVALTARLRNPAAMDSQSLISNTMPSLPVEEPPCNAHTMT